MVEAARGDAITVWDSDAEPLGHTGRVYRWKGYEQTGSVYSLLGYVEVHGERLRRKYLAWIHDLGENRIDGKRLIDHLVLEDGFSYWWLTELVEQSPWKTSDIVAAIRLLALEEIILEHRPGTVQLVSADRRLHEILADLCRTVGAAYEWKWPPDRPVRRWTVRSLYLALPQTLKGLVSFSRYVWGRWALRHSDRSGWFGGRALFLCSYFIHLDAKSCALGHFRSHHWEALPGLAHELGYDTNWLQHYLASKAVPDTGAALQWVRSFNHAARAQGFHCFLDAYLSWRILLRVMRRWVWLRSTYRRLQGVERGIPRAGTHLLLWPLLRASWRAAFSGPTALSNLLWLELFDAALSAVPHQSTGVYLCENQGWERAFIRAWRKHGHGRLVAVAHSTVRFWDLRYFTDVRTLRSRDRHALPQADFVALNGKSAIDSYLEAGFPQELIVECEALRYNYLHRGVETAARRIGTDAIKVLILGDYSATGTLKMLRLLEAAAGSVQEQATFTVKPHPNCHVEAASFPILGLTVRTNPLGEILHEFDIAYSSAATSAAVDAYLAGLPVVVMLDGAELNFSPLRGRQGVRFVSTAVELAEALQVAAAEGAVPRDHEEFFFLDPCLPRWRRLLGPAAIDAA